MSESVTDHVSWRKIDETTVIYEMADRYDSFEDVERDGDRLTYVFGDEDDYADFFDEMTEMWEYVRGLTGKYSDDGGRVTFAVDDSSPTMRAIRDPSPHQRGAPIPDGGGLEPVRVPDEVLRPGSSRSTSIPSLHIPRPDSEGDEAYCYTIDDAHSVLKKPIEMFPEPHRDWCSVCVQRQRAELAATDGGATEPVHGVLVACGDVKAPDLSRAKDLYTSNYFQLKREYAEQHADLWRVVSAEHGLLRPDQLVAPYDTTLDDLSGEEERAWLADLAENLHDLHIEDDVDRWTVLAGGEYLGAVDLIMTKLRVIDVETPTAGLPIGKRMEWLKEQVEDERKEIEV